jgi:hypothetical protein
VVVNLVGFGDESGIQEGARWCVLAGYIGEPREWERFNKKWSGTLERYEISEFKSSEFWGREERTGARISPYRGWSNAKSERFITRLLDLIDQHNIQPVGCSLELRAWNALTEGERRSITGGNLKLRKDQWRDSGSPHPYHAVFHGFIADSAIHRDDYSSRIALILDEQTSYEGRAKYIFARYKSANTAPEMMRFRDLVFAPSHEHPGLQASDLVTHCWYRVHEHGSRTDPERKQAFLRLANKRDKMMIWTASRLENLLAQQPAEYRERLRRMGTAGKELVDA